MLLGFDSPFRDLRRSVPVRRSSYRAAALYDPFDVSEDNGDLERGGEDPMGVQWSPGAADPVARDELARLCSPPLRWGYERVEPPPAARSRERQSRPQREQVRRIARTRASGLWEATALAAAGGVLAIVVDASLGYFSGSVKGVATGAVVATHSIAAVIAFFAARAWYRSPRENRVLTALPARAGGRWVVPLVNAVCAFIAPYLLLPAEAIRGWRRIRLESGNFVPHPGEARRAEAAYATAVAAWEKRIAQFEEAERRRAAEAPLWHPVGFDSNGSVACVFGGTPLGWTAALTTLGASLLGAGARLLVCDLSRRLTVDLLTGLARAAGVASSETILPGSDVESELLDGISWPELSSVLAEALHSTQRDPAMSRRERQNDRSVIREVTDCLDPSGPVSIARLRSALLVVQGAANGSAPIAPGERERLSALFSEVQRAHGSVFERVIGIERALRDFELLDPASSAGAAKPGAAHRSAPGAAGIGGARLQLIGVDKRADELENDCLVDLLFQLLARRVRLGSAPADTLIVLGADRIRSEALEALIDHAAHAHTGIVLMFEHLRHDAIELVGTGGTAAFMALANHREAAEASEFIGCEYQWVESSHTASVSRSLTRTAGESRDASGGITLGLPHTLSLAGSLTRSRSYAQTLGDGAQYSVAETREREAIVDAATLTSLPVTGMIQVAVLPGGGRTITGLDCHPSIALGERVAR